MVPLSDETRRRISALFASPDQSAAAALLEAECADNLPLCETATAKSSERIRYAVLKLSGGDLGALRTWIGHAKIDWRDVLVAAGFATDIDAHRNWNPSR
jgi:hypothetical protein